LIDVREFKNAEDSLNATYLSKDIKIKFILMPENYNVRADLVWNKKYTPDEVDPPIELVINAKKDLLEALKETQFFKNEEEKFKKVCEDYAKQISELVNEVKKYKPYYEHFKLGYKMQHGELPAELPPIHKPDRKDG